MTAIAAIACGFGAAFNVNAQEDARVALQPDETLPRYQVINQELEGILQVLEELTNRSILRPEALPTPKITFDSGGPITAAELSLALESLLSLNGIGISPLGDKFLKVVPLSDIRTQAPELVVESLAGRVPSGKVVSKLFRLQHLDSQTFQQQIQQFLSPGFSSIIPFQNSNAVIVTDTISNLQRLEYVVQEVDQPSRLNIEPAFYTLQFAQASEVAQQVQQMIEDARSRFGDQTGGANSGRQNIGGRRNNPEAEANSAAGESASGSISQILFGSNTAISADDRTNQIIIMTAPNNLKFFEDIIQKLDIKADPSTRMEVIPLKHADAAEVASLLSQFVSGRTGSDTNDRTNSNANSNTRNNRSGGAGNPTFQDSSRVNANNAERNSAANASTSTGEDRDSQFSTFMTILADERSNALVISGTRSDLELMGALVDKIDVLLPQVRIEVVITEVNLNDNDGFSRGMDAFSIGYAGDRDGTGTVTAATNFLGMGTNGTFDFADGVMTNLNLSTVFEVARSNSDVRLLSVPTLTTTHNKEATLVVGESRPIITGSQTSSISDNVRSSVQYQDIGITLTITPLIGPNDVVQLEIDQQIDEVTGEDVRIDTNDQPVIGRRQATSYVSVANGELIVLGGMQRISVENSKRKLGLLGQIPVLGNLFSNKTVGGRKTELLVFIRPLVIRSTDDVNKDAVDLQNRSKADEMLERFMQEGKLDIDGRFEDAEKKKRSSTPKG